MNNIHIREEKSGDLKNIHQLHARNFPTSSEADLVDQLRDDGDLKISLCALSGNDIIGHVAFSTMSAPFPALGLAPISVEPTNREHGVAHQLILSGIKQARKLKAMAVFVLGDPAYYTRFGFSVERAAHYDCVYAGPYLMMLPLDDEAQIPKSGQVEYAKAFTQIG